jgi:hypothetical protein
MPDQWDPKYPVQNEKDQWEEQYEKAKRDLKDPSLGWKPVFQGIIDVEGTLRHLKRFRIETWRKHNNDWVWRWGLWDLHCLPFFDAPKDPVPDYVQAAIAAVPKLWLDEVGGTPGLPDSWKPDGPGKEDRWQTAWAFKATVVLIAGLIEGKIPKSLAT